MTENKSLIGVDFFARDESRQTESISSDLSNWMSHAKGKSILGNSGNDRIPLYQEHHWVDLPQTQGSTRQTHMSIKELGSTSHNTCKDYRSYKKKKNSTYHDNQRKFLEHEWNKYKHSIESCESFDNDITSRSVNKNLQYGNLMNDS